MGVISDITKGKIYFQDLCTQCHGIISANSITGGPSSSCEMIILRNNSYGGIIRLCIGIFTTGFNELKNTSNSQ